MSTSNPKKEVDDGLGIPETLKRASPAAEPANKIESGPPPLPDPFDAKALRLPPAFEVNAGIRKQLTTVPVRKPHSQEWVRVNPDPAYRGNYGVIILKDENEVYLLAPALIPHYENEMTRVTIFTAMSMNKVVFLWPCKLVGSGHKNADRWNSSLIEAAEAAMLRKVRVQSNKALGAYEHSFSDNPTPENDPVWPDGVSFTDLLRLGFVKAGRYIDSHEHEVLKLLLQGY